MGAHGWSSARLGFLVCGYLAFYCGEVVPRAEAGCGERDNPKCCTGRNNDCFEYSKRKTVCYCDAYCQKTGDCCDDYQGVCQGLGELLFLIASHDFEVILRNPVEVISSYLHSRDLFRVDARAASLLFQLESETTGTEVTQVETARHKCVC